MQRQKGLCAFSSLTAPCRAFPTDSLWIMPFLIEAMAAGRWFFLGGLTTILAFPAGIDGACTHEGSLYANNTSWYPGSCQECFCYNELTVCKPLDCTNPHCDLVKGGKLRIPSNQCCPECVSSSEGSCLYQGLTYEHDSQWSPKPCSLCICSRGTVSCSHWPCPPLTCSRDQSLFIPAGECCPKCGRNGDSCFWQGVFHRDGEEWKPSLCTKCVCNNGTIQCAVAECLPVACKPNESPVIQPGHCCPQCVSSLCVSVGKQFKHGDHWQKNACTKCVCDRGQAKCYSHTCPTINCDKGQIRIQRVGQCCEECVAAKGSCLYQGLLRYHGDLWNRADCEFCTCTLGQVVCQRTQCAQVKCTQGSRPVLKPGKCCLECASTKPSCVFEGKFFQNLASWNADDCRECECRDSHVTCFLNSCPTCPPGTLAFRKDDQCCPQCRQARCHADCQMCFGHADHCNSCTNSSLFLHHGRCVSSCPAGFYAEESMCTACPSSCATCSSSWDCQTCGPHRPLLSIDGNQCLTVCPPGSYQHNDTHCRRCHDLCLTCRGPGQMDCISCMDPAALLKDGLCVLDCGKGFYSQTGICYACDASCTSCFPDNPKCMSCPPGTALHNGKCLTKCPDKHYLEKHSRCRACHSSCTSCWGPSVSQCSHCSVGLYLHQGQCVESCGEGLYSHINTCHNCHPTCRSCAGPLASDCLLCRKPEEVLHPQSSHSLHGQCASGCSTHSFLDYKQSCRECHPSCWDCIGPSADNCTSCRAPGSLHQGRCEPTCPPAFFIQGKECQACHPSCKTCSGPSEAECTSCPPLVSLQSGHCSTHCQEGKFLHSATGKCLRCSSDCQRCSADLQVGQGSVCLRCKAAHTWLLGDQCVSKCPPGHYVHHGGCIKCHPSCEACSGPGTLPCTSCPSNTVLLPSGLCAAMCPPGYYDNSHRICQVCDSQCLTCDAATVCTSCRDPSKVLLFGECRYDKCAHQYYLNVTTRSCRECDWSCNACQGPLRTDCLQCMEGYLRQDGACLQGCSLGFYQDGDLCLGCDDYCSQCWGPGQCVECHPPYAILKGHCVLNCGRNYFLDNSSRVCKPCLSDCVLCDGFGRCTACRETMYLMEGECTPDCGHGFYAEQKTRTCHANSQAPVLQVTGFLQVSLGGLAALLPALMEVQDPDSPSEQFVFQLVEAPRNGDLLLFRGGQNGDGEKLSKEDHFSWTDVMLGRIRFRHHRDKTRTGEFILRVADPQLVSLPQTVYVQAVSTLPPRVVTLAPLMVENHGSSAIITKLVLHIDDPDNPTEVQIIVLEPPNHGRLMRLHSNHMLSQFKLGELSREEIQYVHDGSEWSEDQMVLQINDGHSYSNILLHVHISDKVSTNASPLTQSDSQTFTTGVLPEVPGFPRLAPDCDLQITALEDRVTEITHSALSFVDSETPSEKLVYNITKSLPAEQGAIEHREQPYTHVRYFTQADVNQGKIVYRPPQAQSHLQELYQYSFMGLPESLNIYFTVSDGEHTTPELDFTIHLLSNHQQPPVFNVLNPQLEVSLGGHALIGNQQLAVSDADTSPNKLEFELLKAPIHGELIWTDSKANRLMRNGDIFTVSDVTQNVLRYQHTGISTQDDSITFSVSDGISMKTTVVQVIVLGAGSYGPQQDPTATFSLEVCEKSSTVIRRSHLAYTGISPDEQILIHLVLVPIHGILTHSHPPNKPQELREYSSFTMEDINQQRIRYITSVETGREPITDSFHFVVDDGENNRLKNQIFTITITSKTKQAPVVTLHNGIKVQEGGRVQLSTNQIMVSDVDTPNKDILLWLITPPKYGFIENTKRGSAVRGSEVVTPDTPFSVEDLLSDHIFYVQGQKKPQAKQDVFSMYISDGNSQTEAFTVEIHIQSEEDRDPVVSVSSIHIEENSGVVITNLSLSVVEYDTPENEMVFTVITVPSYGKLRRRQFNTQPLENGRILTQGSTFTYQDVLDKLMVYTPETVSEGIDKMEFTFDGSIYTQTARLEFTMDYQRSEGPRMTVNRGLQLSAGSSSKVTEQNLKGIDINSDNLKLRYILTKDPLIGKLQLGKSGHVEEVSVKGPVQSFTQDDVNKGLLEYSHTKGEKGGSTFFKFNLIDQEGNKLIDQSFVISVLEDHLPPTVVSNKGLLLDENSMKKLTTLQLSASDQDTEPRQLIYHITKQPSLGHLEHTAKPGSIISMFTQSDLASRSVQYIHTSEEEKHTDQFSFSLSDGTNEVAQTFYITIKPLDDSLPVLQVPGIRVQEGVRKTITEFDLKATDADTEVESIIFTIVQPPRHGTIERTGNGQHYRQASSFSMDDIYQNRISYNHDGSNSLKDRFTFTVSDSTNLLFVVEEDGKEILTAAPQKFKIEILPVDDSTPRIVINLGLQWLEYMDNKATNLITKKELLTVDPDTEDRELVYEVSTEPRHGFLESKVKPGFSIHTFTQADINLGLVRYVLHEENVKETMDNFKFLVKDSKPNMVIDNVFHIQWSVISFQHKSYNVSEKAGMVAVTVKRRGNLNQYAIVLCRTEQGSASSSSSPGYRPSEQDYIEYAGQVQFDEREDTKVCPIVINDDKVFEGMESFQVEITTPVYALLGENTRTVVNINDKEDEPTLQFDKKTYHVNESTGFIHAPIERKGDTSSIVSALCYTVARSAHDSGLHALESGSDFKSRSMSIDNRVILGPGVSMSTCDVMLVDDSEYELSEEFELVLSDASDNARLGEVTVAKVVIEGPNDASTVTFGNANFTFSEDAGTILIPVLRQGSDLFSVTSVWCSTRPLDPPSANPGLDYIPSSKKVQFKPGKTEETCSLTIIDDIQNPAIEGAETFVVFLSSPQGAVLQEPYEANVVITDTFLDLPSMQFEKLAYTVQEKDSILHIPIFRVGDLSFKSSVRCFTRTMSAIAIVDFDERANTEQSSITFLKGEKVKNCSIHIYDDSVFEPDEEFQVHLGTPLSDHWSGAMVGAKNVVTITITNVEDAPTIQFAETSYQVREPPGPDGIEVLDIKVIRTGDLDRTSKIRCSTRDGSAQSGVDYNPTSRVLKFTPGLDHILFKVEIISNDNREWHESFSLVLGPDDLVEAVLGEITMATVTILDQEAAGSVILPVPPIVVSLADYNKVQEVTKEGSKKTPSPGYPLVCVTPCDAHFPNYSIMKERCEEAGINQTQVHFSWEVAAPSDANGARLPFETVTDNTLFTSTNHMVLDSIYFSRRFHVRCMAQARDKTGHLGTPLRSNITIISTEGSICHTPLTTGTAQGFQAQSFIAALKYLDVKHEDHPNRIHISVQIPHQDGMLPLISTMPLHNLNFLLSESIYRQQHVCSNLVTLKDLKGLSDSSFLDDVPFDSISLGPGYDRPYQFNSNIREAQSIQLYKHLNLKSCIWTFDAYYDMTELIDMCGGSVTSDFQVRDSAQSFLTVRVPLYVSYIYVTAPRGWASLEHHTEMEISFFYDTVLWMTGIQTDSILSARLQIIRIYIREDGRLVIEFKTHAKFRGQFVSEHHTLPSQKSHLTVPDHLRGMDFDLQLLWSARTFDSPYQLWRATSSYSRNDYSGEYIVLLIPCTVQPTQPWIDHTDKALSCTAHAPEKFLVPIAFQQTNRPVPVVYSLNTEFHLCNNEKVFMMDPANTKVSMADMDYKGAFSMGQTLYGRVLWNPEQNLNAAYKLQLEKVYLCTGRDGYVPFFDPTGTLYNEGPQYGCIQPSKFLKHRFLLLDRKQPNMRDRFFHDVPFEAHFASELPELQDMVAMPGVDGFTIKVDALYKVEAGHQWYLQVIYVISPESQSSPRVQRSLIYKVRRSRRDWVDRSSKMTLDESLIFDNEGDQVKNGTNMKSLHLETGSSVSFIALLSSSVGVGVATVTLLVLLLLASCFLFCCAAKKNSGKGSKTYGDNLLNTKVQVCLDKGVEKNFSTKHCMGNILNTNQEPLYKAKVKQVNLEVKLHNKLNDGTEV